MPSRPQPRFPEPDTQHYWDGVKNHELRYQYCEVCSMVNFYPSAHCRQCGKANLVWRTSQGEGTIYTFSVVRQNRIPGFVELGAYAVAYVDLDEGFRMLTNIVGAEDPTTDIAIGQRVRVEFEDQETGDYPIPVFRAI
ncbi:MAG TPA: OB-fold domain-containing protein [Dehalococcoidia bacterium]|nr:OB-fold domain-containing protein [Dehalococcoidia bacterium]